MGGKTNNRCQARCGGKTCNRCEAQESALKANWDHTLFLGVTDFVSEVKSVANYPQFEKLAHVIQHGLQGRVVQSVIKLTQS